MYPKVLLIDNRDSFTWNLAQLFEESGLCRLSVRLFDEISLAEMKNFDKLVLSPGPGIPSEIPLLNEIICHFGGKKSILGICLGHQAIVEAMGGKLINLSEVKHGIQQDIHILEPEDSLFAGISGTFKAGLYHSWAADISSLPDCLRISAISSGNTIMSVSHASFNMKGIQFHPESYMCPLGYRIISNWLTA